MGIGDWTQSPIPNPHIFDNKISKLNLLKMGCICEKSIREKGNKKIIRNELIENKKNEEDNNIINKIQNEDLLISNKVKKNENVDDKIIL